jgi:ABC-type antimicrobial peptide transport system permease subunit
MSSVIVKVDGGGAVAGVVARGGELGLTPKDTRARDVSVLVSGVMGLLALVAAVIFLVSASNIAYTFRVLAAERRAEIALYRAVGARSRDVLAWMLGLATTVGVLGGVVGLVVARSLALAADWAGARYLPDFPFKPSSFFAFPLWLVALGAAFAALFSVLGALGPARSASRTDPSIALASGVN